MEIKIQTTILNYMSDIDALIPNYVSSNKPKFWQERITAILTP